MQGNTYLICNSNLKRLQLYNSRLWIWKRKPSNRREGKIGDGLLCLCTYVSVTPHSFNLFCDCLWSTSWMPSTVLGVRDSKALPTRCSENKMRIAFKPKLQCNMRPLQGDWYPQSSWVLNRSPLIHPQFFNLLFIWKMRWHPHKLG